MAFYDWLIIEFFPSLGNLLGIILNFAVLDVDALHTLLIGNNLEIMYNNPFLDGRVMTITLYSYGEIVTYLASLDMPIVAGIVSLITDLVSIFGSLLYTIIFSLPFDSPLCIGFLIGIVRAFIIFTMFKWILSTFDRE